MLILLFVIQELSYDRFFPGPGKIYRATMDFQAAGKANTMAITPTPLGPALQENFPEVESYARISRTWNPVLLESEGKKFFENNLIYADSGFFNTFGYKLTAGNQLTALQLPHSIVLTESMAAKYFGGEDPVGKILRANARDNYTVTGLMKDPPVHTHLQFDAIASFTTIYAQRGYENIERWTGNINYYQYLNIRLEPGRIRETVKNIEELWTEIDQDYPLDYVFIDQSFSNLYDQEYRLAGIFVFFTVLAILSALLGLYSLVSYAAASRTREIGVRKVMGADIPGILALFTREFVVLMGISTLMAWPAAYFFISNWLKEFAYQTSITPWPFIAGALLVAFLTIAVVVSRSFQAALINPARSLRHE